MRRLVVLLAATLAGSQSADARPPYSQGGDLRSGGGTDLSRGVLLGVANGVNLLSSSVVAYELATGKKALAATGITLLLTGPTLAYTITEIRSDPDDVLLYATATWSAALLTKAVIDLIRNHDPESARSNDRVIIQPMFDPGGKKPAIGLDFSGQF